MRSWLLVGLLAACGGTETSSTVEDQSAAGTSSRVDPNACGRVELRGSGDVSTNAQPSPTREMWLAESLNAADAVVVARSEGERWRVQETLCGDVPDAPTRLSLGADASDLAVRFLVQTPRGYFDVGPLDRAATRDEWSELAEGASARDSIPLEVEASAGDDHVAVSLGDGGDNPLARRVFSAGGRITLWERRPAEGPGFRIVWSDDGTLSEYEHFVDQKNEGVHRTFYDNGRIEREIHYRAGRRHGPTREFRRSGRLKEERTYEDGFIPPITRPNTEATEATLSEEPVATYRAPQALIERIRRGMRVREVADLLGLPVSAALGVDFPGDSCDAPGTHVHFRRGRVSRIEHTSPSGACEGP